MRKKAPVAKRVEMMPSQKKRFEQFSKAKACAKVVYHVPSQLWYSILLFQLYEAKNVLRFELVCKMFRAAVKQYEQPIWFVLCGLRFKGGSSSIPKLLAEYSSMGASAKTWKAEYVSTVAKLAKIAAAKQSAEFKMIFTKHFTALMKNVKQIVPKLKIAFLLAGLSSSDQKPVQVSPKSVRYFDNAFAFPVVFLHIAQTLPALAKLPPIRLSISALAGTISKQWKSYSLTSPKLLYEDKAINIYQQENLLFGAFSDGTLAFMYVSANYIQLFSALDHDLFPPLLPDDIDQKFGLHDYSLALELRDFDRTIWVQEWDHLDVAGIHGDFAELCVVSSVPSENRYSEICGFDGELGLSWKSAAFGSVVRDRCYLDITIKDEFNTPVHADTTLVAVQHGADPSGSSKQHMSIKYEDAKGEIRCTLEMERDNEQKTAVRIADITLEIHRNVINTRFHTEY